MKKNILYGLLLLSFLGGGCLPMVGYITYTPEVQGQVLTVTGAPVAGLPVTVSYGALEETVRTDELGRFTAGPLRHWFYAWALGAPEDVVPFPSQRRNISTLLWVEIEYPRF